MAAPKGHPRWGGRNKSTPNKMTASARAAIELAFEGMGGVQALTTWAEGNPTEFYTRVWPKILPLQIAGDPENPLALTFPQVSASSNWEWLQRHIAPRETVDGPASADSNETSQ